MSKRSGWAGLPTEAVHARTKALDTMSADAVLELMAREDRRVIRAVRGESRRIERAARAMAEALTSGGRTFYLGAGTSGRLGVLEASECPPTYGTAPEQIVAIMAGGDRSVFRSKEGAEDDEGAAERALTDYGVSSRDCVIGISASSVTPFVLGGLRLARARRASTVLVTCGPRVRGVADIVIAPPVGPEVLAGSTRLKCGTATKLVLNQMTLLAMIRANKVYGPNMVDLKATSAKLRDRAARMDARLGRVDRASADELLAVADGEVKTAVVMGRLGLTCPEARERLTRCRFDVRRVLES